MTAAGRTLAATAPDGVCLHLATAGDAAGTPIILLHGFPDSSSVWRRQMAPLAEAGYRVVAPDLRGHGASDCPQPVAAYTLDRLVGDVLAIAGDRPVHLVGHDWGGIVAWAVAAWRPDRVDRLSIINAPHPDVAAAVLRRDPLQAIRSSYVALFQLSGIAERLLRARGFWLLRRMVRAAALRDTFSAEDLAACRRQWARPGRLTAMLNYYRALVRLGHAPLGRIAVPTQILWGRRDAALGYPLAEASLAMCERGRLQPLPDASHWPQLDRPAAIAQALIAFHHARAQQ